MKDFWNKKLFSKFNVHPLGGIRIDEAQGKLISETNQVNVLHQVLHQVLYQVSYQVKHPW